jgi:flavin reductase (DIM6/NTAB) family NADH-FMN oxidoreductase RutF
MTVDSQTFRQSVGAFASGVTVVTSHDPSAHLPIGVTISSFCSVSEDPPLVLFCLDKHSKALLAINANGHFGVNILACDQKHLSERFAAKDDGQWLGIDHHPGLGKVPLLAGAIAHLECSLHKEFSSGDHSILVGLVETATFDAEKRPLLYYRRNYADMKNL